MQYSDELQFQFRVGLSIIVESCSVSRTVARKSSAARIAECGKDVAKRDDQDAEGL